MRYATSLYYLFCCSSFIFFLLVIIIIIILLLIVSIHFHHLLLHDHLTTRHPTQTILIHHTTPHHTTSHYTATALHLLETSIIYNTDLYFKFSIPLYSILLHSRFLISTPMPWGPTGCAMLSHQIITAIQLLQRILKKRSIAQSNPSLLSSSTSTSFNTSTSTSSSATTLLRSESSGTQSHGHRAIIPSLPLDLSMWVNSLSRCTPVFVINLDRRSDRSVNFNSKIKFHPTMHLYNFVLFE